MNIQEITSPDNIIVTRAVNASSLVQLATQLKQEYLQTTNTAGPKSYTPELNEVVAAKYMDGEYYRVLTKKFYLDGTVQCQFMDYGNMDDLPVTNLYQLKDYLTELPLQV